MRMWMVTPSRMCMKHLLGEHVELHMLVGSIQKNKNISGFIAKGLVEPRSIWRRHAALVREMQRRGYTHNSPLPLIDVSQWHKATVNRSKSARDLARRCSSFKQK